MKYLLPDQATLIKYLALLREVLLETRYCPDQQRVSQLMDAVENIPDLLCRWPDMNEDIVYEDLRRYEKKYLNGLEKYTGILRNGPREDWQLKQR